MRARIVPKTCEELRFAYRVSLLTLIIKKDLSIQKFSKNLSNCECIRPGLCENSLTLSKISTLFKNFKKKSNTRALSSNCLRIRTESVDAWPPTMGERKNIQRSNYAFGEGPLFGGRKLGCQEH